MLFPTFGRSPLYYSEVINGTLTPMLKFRGEVISFYSGCPFIQSVLYRMFHSCIYSPTGKGIISGHADGTIVRYFFEEDGAGLARV